MNLFTKVRQPRLAAAIVMAAVIPLAGFAQQVPPPPPEVLEDGIVPADPHAILGELAGGPDGSPTALRLNPLPGTSTSIPTMYPAAIPPIAERQGGTVVREETGIEGQCDPVVSLGECPPPAAAQAAAQAATTGDAPAVTGATNAETVTQPGTGQTGNGQTGSSGN